MVSGAYKRITAFSEMNKMVLLATIPQHPGVRLPFGSYEAIQDASLKCMSLKTAFPAIIKRVGGLMLK